MDIGAAKTAGAIAAQIEALKAQIAQIDLAIAEKWPITVLRVSAPAVGSSLPGGTTIDLVPSGKTASADNSALALSTAKVTFQTALDALAAQLAAL